jgi:hypothetical protein
VTFSGEAPTDSIFSVLLDLALGFQRSLKLFCLFPAPGLRALANEWAIRSQNSVDPFRASATFVIDVVRRAGRVVAGVKREHEFGLFAKSIVGLLYDFSDVFIKCL